VENTIRQQGRNVTLDELLERIEAIPMWGGKPDSTKAAALLGDVSEPPITVTQALDYYRVWLWIRR